MHVKKAEETKTFHVDFGYHLHRNELLSGTPTVEERHSADLTISGVGLTDLEQTILGRVTPLNHAVSFTVAGGTAGELYTLRITVGTNTTVGQILIRDFILRVN